MVCKDYFQAISYCVKQLLYQHLLTAGEDYTPFHKVRAFPIGSTNGARNCFNMDIINDNCFEDLEIFTIQIKIVDLNVWVTPGSLQHTVQIIDDDSKNCIHKFGQTLES